jgi:hypothetical protein
MRPCLFSLIFLLVLPTFSGCTLFLKRLCPDDDGDGYGSGEFSEEECIYSEGKNLPDCDDSNPDINPDAEEICDGIDNNCDGEVDETCGVI